MTPGISRVDGDRAVRPLRKVGRLNAAAEGAGRDPHSLRKVYNLNGVIGSESHEPFQGSVQQWIDQLLDTVERFGMNAFVFWPNEDHDRQRQIFAEQVVPEVRQALAG